MSTPRTCSECGQRPEKIRANGAPLGRCDECLASNASPPGTVVPVDGGKRWRKKTEDGKWVACAEDGGELTPFVRGRLADIIAQYNLVPAGALFPVGTGPTARASDPVTSKAAGTEAARPDRLWKQQYIVLRTVPGRRDEPSSLTDGHGAILAGIHPGSYSKRRGELVDAGYVECTGEGVSPYGRRAQLWTRTELGDIVLHDLEAGAL